MCIIFVFNRKHDLRKIFSNFGILGFDHFKALGSGGGEVKGIFLDSKKNFSKLQIDNKKSELTSHAAHLSFL